jgi:hypothetical protein
MKTQDSLTIELVNGTKIETDIDGQRLWSDILRAFDKHEEGDTLEVGAEGMPIRVVFRLDQLKSLEITYSEKVEIHQYNAFTKVETDEHEHSYNPI